MQGPMKLALVVGMLAGVLLQLPHGILVLVIVLAGWHLLTAALAFSKSRFYLLSAAHTLDAAVAFLIIPISRHAFTEEALPYAAGLILAWTVTWMLRRLERRRSPALREAWSRRDRSSVGELLSHSWLPRRFGGGLDEGGERPMG